MKIMNRDLYTIHETLSLFGKINKHNQFSALNDVKGFFQKIQ